MSLPPPRGKNSACTGNVQQQTLEVALGEKQPIWIKNFSDSDGAVWNKQF